MSPKSRRRPMPLVVDLAMVCLRTGRRFLGEGLQRSEVTEALSRLRVPLVTSGGVELAVYNGEEQVALSPMLDLWVFSKSDRWFYLLLGEGLEEVSELQRRTWAVAANEFTGAPALVEAVSATALRLTLKAV